MIWLSCFDEYDLTILSTAREKLICNLIDDELVWLYVTQLTIPRWGLYRNAGSDDWFTPSWTDITLLHATNCQFYISIAIINLNQIIIFFSSHNPICNPSPSPATSSMTLCLHSPYHTSYRDSSECNLNF